LDAKQFGSQWLISAAAVKSGVCRIVEGDQHAATAGMSVIYKICRARRPCCYKASPPALAVSKRSL
jgi:hypothetical protein